MTTHHTLLSLAVFCVHLWGIATAVVAIMRTRTPQGAIAWAAALISVPYVALPAYWVLGRSRFHGYREAIRARSDSVTPLLEKLKSAVQEFAVKRRSPALTALQALARFPLTRGNALTLLVNGDATFDDIVQGIARAKTYVLVEFYIVRDDGLGGRLADALLASAARGVSVRFLYDGLGSLDLDRAYVNRLREGGVEIHTFNTTKGRGNRFQLNFRNHRKIVVVDGEAAWVGGHNVGDEYLGLDPKVGPWRDTHVRIDGPAALGPQLSFAADWVWVTDEVLDLETKPHAAEQQANAAQQQADAAQQQDCTALTLSSGPADVVDGAELFFAQAINTAQERVWIASPYFVPTPSVVTALQLAALRGVEIRVLTPKNNDSKMVALAALGFMAQLGPLGVRFSFYPVGFMHQKVMLVDSRVSVIGTHNFDFRSFRLNFEISAVVDDEPFARQVEAMLKEDLDKSEAFDPATLRERPFWFRFAIRLAQLTAPIQ